MRILIIGAMLLVAVGSPASAQTHGEEAVEIPLRVDGGRLIVPVSAPDGTVFEFALSTGNGVTILSESVAAHLGDQGGLTVGGLPLPMDESATLSDEELSADGKVLDGMISSNMLNQFDVLIDVPGERLVLRPLGRSVGWEGMTMSEPVRLRVLHGIFLSFDVELNGREYPAMLDLGMTTLVVNEAVKAEMHGAGDVGTLGLGSTTIPDLSVRMLDLPLFGGWDPNNEGFVVVGAPIAYDCAISLSWVRQELRTCVR